MKKNITPNLCKVSEDKKVVAPSIQTLDFIKQFARSYYVEKKLPNVFCGVCVN